MRTLVDPMLEPGLQEIVWDGRGPDGKPVAAGIYFGVLETGGTTVGRALSRIR